MRKIKDLLTIKVELVHIAIASSIFICFFTIFGFLSQYIIFLESFSGLRVQYFAILLLLITIFIFKKKYIWVVVLSVLSVINFIIILPLYFNTNSSIPTSNPIKIIHVNVHITNKDYSRLIKYINEQSPDIILLEEVTIGWEEVIQNLQKIFPYGKYKFREDCFGIALLSKIPISNIRFFDFGDVDVPSVIAEMQIKDKSIMFIGTHLLPPIIPSYINDRTKQIDGILQFISVKKDSIIIIGDLNMTPWSPLFKRLLKEGDLKNSQAGYGIMPTWPVQLPIFLIPIDHCLVTEDISIVKRKIGPNIGSDHYPLLVDIGVK